jgi:hypothetical protein
MFGRRRLTRVEIALYAFVVATLFLVFASYVLDYMEMAEKTAMETTVTNVSSALTIYYATEVLAGKRVDEVKWLQTNPFEIVKAFPPNYVMDLGGREPASLDRPAWYFDAKTYELVYLPRLYSHLETGGEPEVRFRFRANPSGIGFVLAPTNGYSWTMSALQIFHKLDLEEAAHICFLDRNAVEIGHWHKRSPGVRASSLT